MNRSRRVATGLVVGALLLSGCAVLPGGGPAALDTYDLTTPQISASGRRHSGMQILIAEPGALKPLDGQNIVVRPAPGSIEYLKGAQWGDRLPKVVQARLAETFQRSGRFGGVGKPGEGLAIDYQVIAELRAFDIRLDGNARAHVELFVRLMNDRNGTVRAARSFKAEVPIAAAGNAAYVSALDRAFGEMALEIVAWTTGAI